LISMEDQVLSELFNQAGMSSLSLKVYKQRPGYHIPGMGNELSVLGLTQQDPWSLFLENSYISIKLYTKDLASLIPGAHPNLTTTLQGGDHYSNFVCAHRRQVACPRSYSLACVQLCPMPVFLPSSMLFEVHLWKASWVFSYS
jgi:hypothetical protein